MGLGHRYREQLLECFVTGFAGFLLHTNQLNATRLVASTMQLHLIVASHILHIGVVWGCILVLPPSPSFKRPEQNHRIQKHSELNSIDRKMYQPHALGSREFCPAILMGFSETKLDSLVATFIRRTRANAFPPWPRFLGQTG
jgi:hypothetical protein